jgi:hypothetical protein
MKGVSFISIIIILSAVLSSFAQEEILIRKYFRNRNTYVIVCKGFPNESLTGKPRIESAKEAALINAQIIARALFDDSVDVFRYGLVEKYRVYRDYAIVYYVIRLNNLRQRLR